VPDRCRHVVVRAGVIVVVIVACGHRGIRNVCVPPP